jgi:CBS domain-containing protein
MEKVFRGELTVVDAALVLGIGERFYRINKQGWIDVNGTRSAPSRVSTRVVTIGPKEAASEAWTRMRRRRIRHLVVMEGTRLVGVLSERDLGGRAGADMRTGRRVQDLMTAPVESAEPETTVLQAATLMRKRLIGSLPVLDGNRLVGIVTATDVFDALGSVAADTMSRAERQLLRAATAHSQLSRNEWSFSASPIPTASCDERPSLRSA